MFTKNLNLIAALSVTAFMSAGAAQAADTDFNKKELNGRTSYIGVSMLQSDIAPVNFHGAKRDFTDGTRAQNQVGFEDGDGYLVTLGNDYGYVRLETEFGYHDSNVNKIQTGTRPSGAIDIGTAMVNLAFEYSVDPSELAEEAPSGFSITPFVQVGGGAFGVLGNLNYGEVGGNGELYGVDNGFFIAPAIQGAAGLTVGLPYGAEVFAQYSEMLAYTYSYRGSDDIHLKQVSGGIRLNF